MRVDEIDPICDKCKRTECSYGFPTDCPYWNEAVGEENG